MMTTSLTSALRNSKLRRKNLLVKFDASVCEYVSISSKQSIVDDWVFLFPDAPSELEPTSSEELIPGLLDSTVDIPPQETGMSSL